MATASGRLNVRLVGVGVLGDDLDGRLLGGFGAVLRRIGVSLDFELRLGLDIDLRIDLELGHGFRRRLDVVSRRDLIGRLDVIGWLDVIGRLDGGDGRKSLPRRA